MYFITSRLSLLFSLIFVSCWQLKLKLLVSKLKVNVVSSLLDIPGFRWPKYEKSSQCLLISTSWKCEIRKVCGKRKTSKSKASYFWNKHAKSEMQIWRISSREDALKVKYNFLFNSFCRTIDVNEFFCKAMIDYTSNRKLAEVGSDVMEYLINCQVNYVMQNASDYPLFKDGGRFFYI